jgi:hypothetical protein
MDVTASGHAAALWVGLHLALLLVLAVLVTRQRRKHRVALGAGGVPQLEQAIRAHANATEYVPAALIGLVMLAVVGAPPLVVHVIGLALFVGRVAHGIGLSRSGDATPPRAIGILLTWLAYIAAIVALLFYAIP